MQIIAPSRPNIPRQHILSLEVDFYTDVLLKLNHLEAKSVDLSTIVSPPKIAQKLCSQSVLYSEVPLYSVMS